MARQVHRALIGVLVVEDRPGTFSRHVGYLRRFADIDVIGVARSGTEVPYLLRRRAPDVLLLGLEAVGMGGFELMRSARAVHPNIEVLVLSDFANEKRALRAIAAGASGYLLKSVTPERLVEAIRDVKAGGAVIDPRLTRGLLSRIRNTATATDAPLLLPSSDEGRPRHLSAREVDILLAIAQRLTVEQTAARFGLSFHTVRSHLQHIFEKLGVHSRVEAVMAAIERGLIRL